MIMGDDGKRIRNLAIVTTNNTLKSLHASDGQNKLHFTNYCTQ
jgi:hypothetical protein